MLKDAFEKVYVMNLEGRPERLTAFFGCLPGDWPFKKPERYEALDGKIVTPPKWWNGGNGAWGCYRTHLNILEECLNRGIHSVLIMEDDAVCIDGFGGKVEHFWNHLPDDWSMVYLGGQHLQENLRLPRKVNDWVYRPYNINRTHCYGIRGRKMLETVYRHLHDYTSWNVNHHVDHYLGELHKATKNGLYVPREWLVAQSEGRSDITWNRESYRLFCGAEELIAPKIDVPCIAVMGTYFGGGNTVAGVLQRLGFSLGSEIDNAKTNVESFEDFRLQELCRQCYTEPWLEEHLTCEDRVNHLRHWAGRQCQPQRRPVKVLCGYHPILSLMGAELREAWNEPKFILLERPDEECWQVMQRMPWCWHPQSVKYAFGRLRRARETFLKTSPCEILPLTYQQIMEQSDASVVRICEFLNHRPGSEQYHHAVRWIQQSENDVTFTFE
ncbi:MAG: hypothetical protein FWD31_05000 [Planctomycetaceae bacterium]|nr:hypothetical protein [Planctomycetaceae bacterium]